MKNVIFHNEIEFILGSLSDVNAFKQNLQWRLFSLIIYYIILITLKTR